MDGFFKKVFLKPFFCALSFFSFLSPSAFAGFPEPFAAAWREGDFETAEALLTQAGATRFSDADYWREVFFYFLDRAQPQAALYALDEWEEKGGAPSPPALRALALLATGNLQAVLDLPLDEKESSFFLKLEAERLLVQEMRGKEKNQHLPRLLSAWRRYTSLFPRVALGWWRLGEAAEENQRWKEALGAYEQCVRYDGNYKKAYARLAVLRKKTGDVSRALRDFEKAARVLPRDEDVQKKHLDLKKDHPEQTARKEEQRKAAWETWTIPKAEPLPASGTAIRIGLSVGVRQVVFRSSGGLRCIPSEGDVLDFPAGTQGSVVFQEKTSFLQLQVDGKTIVSSKALVLESLDAEKTIALHAVEGGRGYFFAEEEDRAYRGRLSFEGREGGITVVNEVSLEEATAGVLPGEMPSTWPLEALKTQAVAARSDLLAKRGRHRTQGFDVCDEVHCQVYKGVGAEKKSILQAVRETQGEILEIKGKPLAAVYSAQCGGHTQDFQEAWGGGSSDVIGTADYAARENQHLAFPISPAGLWDFLQEDVQAYCRLEGLPSHRRFRWKTLIHREDLERRAPEVGEILSVQVVSRSKAGFARVVKIVGKKGERLVREDAVRGWFSVRSNLFWIFPLRKPNGEVSEFLLWGGGFGHGVGLCQEGVLGRVLQGQSYRSILKAYYPQGRLKKWKEK